MSPKGWRRAGGSVSAALFVSLVTASFLGSAGCLKLGTDFPTEGAGRIEIGTTTREEIREWFGEPDQIGLDSGRLAWTYFYYKLALIGTHRSKELYVVFEPDGRVRSFTFNTSFPDEQARIQPSR